VFFAILTLASIGLPTTSGFTGEFLVLLGAFRASWLTYQTGAAFPLAMSVIAVSGVVLGALYMLWFAQRFLFGLAKAPSTEHGPLTDLNTRERLILVAIVAAVFALGLYPDEPMRKTELAAKQYQQLVGTPRATSVVQAAAMNPHRNPSPVGRGALHPSTSGRGTEGEGNSAQQSGTMTVERSQ
jgi:NADH-quinone oxidoreductase subunit M